jgi:hypothetical protein
MGTTDERQIRLDFVADTMKNYRKNGFGEKIMNLTGKPRF